MRIPFTHLLRNRAALHTEESRLSVSTPEHLRRQSHVCLGADAWVSLNQLTLKNLLDFLSFHFGFLTGNFDMGNLNRKKTITCHFRKDDLFLISLLPYFLGMRVGGGEGQISCIRIIG